MRAATVVGFVVVAGAVYIAYRALEGGGGWSVPTLAYDAGEGAASAVGNFAAGAVSTSFDAGLSLGKSAHDYVNGFVADWNPVKDENSTELSDPAGAAASGSGTSGGALLSGGGGGGW